MEKKFLQDNTLTTVKIYIVDILLFTEIVEGIGIKENSDTHGKK